MYGISYNDGLDDQYQLGRQAYTPDGYEASTYPCGKSYDRSAKFIDVCSVGQVILRPIMV